ncbi:hypothetical protein CTI12_AA415250 [Artemisia annua]|uniref:Uncharacterized protein n=1 Tax=Artemisia annua TaxID=35608 RepID=A0A2U1LX42_ARTAN|nr:hypothetical protein CTI12_AA415250 [Artemisia annua]
MEHGPHPPPFTREGILLLNDGSASLDQALKLFKVDFSIFIAKLLQENILVWNEANGHKVRAHGYGCKNITIAISIRDKTKCYQVKGTDPFEDVIRSMIERDLKLSRGHYGLFYKHSNTKIKKDILIETDLD